MPIISPVGEIPIVVSKGGTGADSLTDGGILLGSGTSPTTVTAQPTNGQILIGSTGSDPVLATLTAGSGISISNGAGSVSISVNAEGLNWTNVTGTSQSMSPGNGYLANNASLVTLTLPTTAAQFTSIIIAGNGAGGFSIAQNAGQSINFEGVSTTVGTGGSLSSTQRYDSIELLCVVANTTWNVISAVGSFTAV